MPRWLKFLFVALLITGGGLLTLPWWLGTVLRPVLRAQGITFERYERTDYAHFRLLGVHYADEKFSFAAGQIQSLTPLVWLGQRLRGAAPTVMVADWRAQRLPAPRPGAEARITGLPGLQSAMQRIGPRLGFWLPRIHLSAGELRGFGPDTAVAQADWRDSTLRVDGLRAANQVFAFVIAPAADGSIILTAHNAENDARLHLVLTGANLKGEAVLWEQTLQLAAHFPAQGWLPAEASAVADNWRLPAARLNLGAPYAQVRGNGRLFWRDNKFELAANAKAEPEAKTQAPPFEANATAHGNLRELTLTALHVDAPFATASLTAPVTFSLDHPQSVEPAQLTVQADLAKLPWFNARGKVEGTVRVSGDAAAARQSFALKFSDVVVHDLAIKEARAGGVLAWPLMELTDLKVQLDKASAFTAHGVVNLQTRELAGVALDAQLDAAWFARWLPAGTSWTAAEVTATAEGPLGSPRHQGSLKLTGVQRPPVRPLNVAASWQGEGMNLTMSVRAAAKESFLELAGSLDPRGLQLTKFQFAPAGQPAWQLTAPVRLVWSPIWQIDHAQLSGPASQLALSGQGGAEGRIELAATHFDSSWLQDWMTLTGPAWQLQALSATGQAEDGALVFNAALTAQIAMSPHPAQVKLVATGDAHGVELKELSVVASNRVLTRATGRLPLAWMLEPKPHLSIDETAPLELAASTEPDSPLWATLSAYTGLQLTGPSARINLKGTLRQPVGELQAKVARLGASPDGLQFPLPDLEDLVLAMQFGRKMVTLTTFSAKLDGQAVQAGGKMPMDDSGWLHLWREPATFDWNKAEAHAEIPDADLAPLARRFPNFMAAQGRLRARVELTPGGKFSGELRLTDAASRPWAPFGTLQDINVDLGLADHLITVRSMTAKLGGETVTLEGSVALVPGGEPRFALALKGKNLPLVRNTGLLLRSDLDLRANTDAAGLTHISGALTVRNCLVLANVNLRTLLPTGQRGVTLQPPYFAVQTEPFRHWPLAVDIRAPSAVRMRTTVYNGTASARFQLGGTLGEPRAVGELTVDQGQVLFPFATFKVQQGVVRLPEADPFHAIVSLNATSQRRDYQLRLEMTGGLPEPNATITSTPALEAADVLLMVMTGQPPAGDTTAAGSGGPRLAVLGAYLGRGLFQGLGFGGENRLEISAGEHISREGRETYEFEYKLGERWSLLGEYDEFDAYNAGLKWRVYTEEDAPVEKK